MSEKIIEQTESEKVTKKRRFGLRFKFFITIMLLVSVILITMSVILIGREITTLERQVLNSVSRELNHLKSTAQESIDVDELALSTSLADLQTLEYLSYAFVLDVDGNIIQYFDVRGERNIGEPLVDNVDRELKARKDSTEEKRIEYDDPTSRGGDIYDFSQAVLNPVNDRGIGFVIIGLSDSIITSEIAASIAIIVITSLLFFAFSVFGAILLSGATIRPIKELTKGVAIIGSGNLDHRIEVKSSDEIGELAERFNMMTEQIKEAKEKEIENKIMEEQLAMAKDIQEGLNPMGYYNKGGIQLKGYTRALQGVGGDYFDYIDIDEHRVGALISDVSGKGVPASLVMVMIRTVFTSYITRTDIDCAGVVTAINNSLSADFAIDKFATLFFFIYDRKTEELAFSNAGHGPLYCYRSSKGVMTSTKLDGMPIGIMEAVEYSQARVKLEPGDMIIMYTDGISEMRNSEKEEYGLERINQMVLDKHNLSAEEFVEQLVTDVDKFKGEMSAHDDMTVLVFKREA